MSEVANDDLTDTEQDQIWCAAEDDAIHGMFRPEAYADGAPRELYLFALRQAIHNEGGPL